MDPLDKAAEIMQHHYLDQKEASQAMVLVLIDIARSLRTLAGWPTANHESKENDA